MTPFIMFDAWAAKGRSWRRMIREREMNHDSPENIGSFPVLQSSRSVDARWTAGWTPSKSCTNLLGPQTVSRRHSMTSGIHVLRDAR
jgi:hypothetical protein